MKLIFVVSVAAVLASCESGPATTSAHEGTSPPPSTTTDAPGAAAPGAPAAPAETTSYGANFESGTEVKLASLLSNPSAYSDKIVITEGRVHRACSRKGCWMEIGDGEGACRVTFKDYGFFVPKDSAGAHARLQGRVETREVEPAAVEHLESEGARFRSKRENGWATEVRLVASAVQLTR